MAKHPVNPPLTPDRSRLYVANSTEGTISVIDPASDTVVSTIKTGAPKPSGLAFTPDGKRLVVTLLGETIHMPGAVQVIELATGVLGPIVPLQAQPERLALAHAGVRAYISTLTANTMPVFPLDRCAALRKTGRCGLRVKR